MGVFDQPEEALSLTTIPKITLNHGLEMPQLCFGVFQVTDPDECGQAALSALETGCRLINTAASSIPMANWSDTDLFAINSADDFIPSTGWIIAETGTGSISAGSVERKTNFTPEHDEQIKSQIDDAYRQQYSGYAKNIVESIHTENAHKATLKETPQ